MAQATEYTASWDSPGSHTVDYAYAITGYTTAHASATVIVAASDNWAPLLTAILVAVVLCLLIVVLVLVLWLRAEWRNLRRRRARRRRRKARDARLTEQLPPDSEG